MLENGIGQVRLLDPWTGPAVSAAGSFTGSSGKLVTFTIDTGGVVGTDAIDISWGDGQIVV